VFLKTDVLFGGEPKPAAGDLTVWPHSEGELGGETTGFVNTAPRPVSDGASNITVTWPTVHWLGSTHLGAFPVDR